MMKCSVNNETVYLFPEGRIDSANAPCFEAEIRQQIERNLVSNVVIDAEKLEYVSSSGLRVLLRMKKSGIRLSVINVRPSVFEVLELTGFTMMVEVQKAIRCVSVDTLPLIGKGTTGDVYRLNSEQVIKVYRNAALENIKREREIAQFAFLHDIDTALVFETVRVGDQYGQIFEWLDGISFQDKLEQEPEHDQKNMVMYAEMLKKINSIPSGDCVTNDIAARLRDSIPAITEGWTDEERSILQNLADMLPEYRMLLHNDFGPTNVMVRNDSLLLIDLGGSGFGHPILDLASVYSYFGYILDLIPPQLAEKETGLNPARVRTQWRIFLETYTGTDNPDFLLPLEHQIRLYTCFRLLSFFAEETDTPQLLRDGTKNYLLSLWHRQPVDTLIDPTALL